MSIKQLTCIACPRGCLLTVTADGEDILITGNFCPKGFDYGRQEAVCPLRILTSTVACTDGGRIPVKTSAEIPLADIPRYMKEIRALPPCKRFTCGETLAHNLCASGTDLITTG